MKWDTPARASGSSREPAPTQNPSATERTPGTRSEMTRSPVESSVSSCFDTPRMVSLARVPPRVPHLDLVEEKPAPLRDFRLAAIAVIVLVSTP